MGGAGRGEAGHLPDDWRGNCYWERLKGFSGQFDDIIANGNPTGPARVAIARTDKGFKTSGCDPWRKVG